LGELQYDRWRAEEDWKEETASVSTIASKTLMKKREESTYNRSKAPRSFRAWLRWRPSSGTANWEWGGACSNRERKGEREGLAAGFIGEWGYGSGDGHGVNARHQCRAWRRLIDGLHHSVLQTSSEGRDECHAASPARWGRRMGHWHTGPAGQREKESMGCSGPQVWPRH
jgi:hypothetical protein